MPRDPRHDILFEPVKIGPKVARNRFFQVPHASGMTNAAPHVRAAFREMKAEGGWAVVSTGACSIHPSSDDSPFPCATLWDEADLRSHALMTEAAQLIAQDSAVEAGIIPPDETDMDMMPPEMGMPQGMPPEAMGGMPPGMGVPPPSPDPVAFQSVEQLGQRVSELEAVLAELIQGMQQPPMPAPPMGGMPPMPPEAMATPPMPMTSATSMMPNEEIPAIPPEALPG